MSSANAIKEPGQTGACGEFVREGDADCRLCSIRKFALFADLGDAELDQLTKGIRSGVLRRGSVIYPAASPGAGIFTIRVGLVKLAMKVPGREGRIVRLLGRGATLGLEALAGRPYDHTASALRTTSLCRIPIPTVEALHGRNPRLLHGLMAKWHEQVTWADRGIAVLGTGTVPQRLANLVRLLVDIGGDPLDAVHLPVVADIAAILGVSNESVSRHLAELKRAGLLFRVAPRTYRCDPALILATAGGELSRKAGSNSGVPATDLKVDGAPWAVPPPSLGLRT
jgi:CRP-like cAMP-binding protein